MGKSIRSNKGKAFRSQRRSTVVAEGWLVDSEAKRAAALQKCVDAPTMPRVSIPARCDIIAAQAAADGEMQEDGAPKRGRSRARDGDAPAGGSGTPGEAGMEVDGEDDEDSGPGRRGPNQYKKQGLLKRGAKRRAGVNKKTAVTVKIKKDKKAPMRQHGVQVGGKKKPRFSKTSKTKRG